MDWDPSFGGQRWRWQTGLEAFIAAGFKASPPHEIAEPSMESRVFRTLAARSLILLAIVCPAAVSLAQVQPATGHLAPVVAADLNLDITAVLRQGRELEQQRRWDAALSHYEDARKRFPGDSTLERRYKFARMHYDVGRRYNDDTFRRMAGELPLDQARDLYAEVLLKIDTHYVDEPNWKGLVDHGTDMLDIALTDEAFLAKNLPGVSGERVNGFRNLVRQTMDPARIESRDDAHKAVHWAAYEAQRQLGLSATSVVLEYACGATNSLDDYTSFLSSGELKELYAQIRGNFVGLGIELKASPKGLLILRVISGSPAQRAGLRPRDVIVAVDGRSTLDMNADKAADLLQGPENTSARVTLVSPGQPARDVEVRREQVDVPSVDDVKILDPSAGIAYFRLNSFQETTDREVNDALWKLHHQGMKSLIIDLRGNPGGLLKSAVDVIDRFVPRGTIVSTRGRNGQENQTYRATKGERYTWSVPLVVLIDGDSASASEIFAGAIRDHERGVLVGRKSYGKGSVQGIFSLRTADTGIRLTTAKFYSPKGKPFSKVGVEPQIHVRQAAKPLEDARILQSSQDDPDIAAGVGAIRDGVVRTFRAN
jgi:carboxyl-terminal processing protease